MWCFFRFDRFFFFGLMALLALVGSEIGFSRSFTVVLSLKRRARYVDGGL